MTSLGNHSVPESSGASRDSVAAAFQMFQLVQVRFCRMIREPAWCLSIIGPLGRAGHARRWLEWWIRPLGSQSLDSGTCHVAQEPHFAIAGNVRKSMQWHQAWCNRHATVVQTARYTKQQAMHSYRMPRIGGLFFCQHAP